MHLKRRNKSAGPELELETAGRMLEEIFRECEKHPNKVPLEILVSYSNYRKERYSAQKTVLTVILVLFFLLPLLFIPPTFSLSLRENSSPGSPVYSLSVGGFLPVTRVTATVDGRNMPVYETGNALYDVEPTMNGTLTVSVTLFNHQYAVQSLEVNTVDHDPPALLDSYMEGDSIFLTLSDSGSGINYANIYMMTADGIRRMPVWIVPESGLVQFPCIGDSMNVYVSDLSGNQLHLLLTIK